MCQHRVCKASWGPPHNGRNVGDRSGRTGHGGQQRAREAGRPDQGPAPGRKGTQDFGTGHQVTETAQRVG